MLPLVVITLASFIISAFGDDCRPGTCKPDQTCCPTNIPTIFGCCEYDHAVCCADRTHCCPKDTVCDLEKGACFPRMKEISTPKSLNTLEKRQGALDDEWRFERKVMCDTKTYCPFGSTCCLNNDGSYDCCPYSSAMCCPDQLHCCSSGSVCHESSEYCMEEDDGARTSSEPKEPAFEM